jgi:hypothetical protein
MRGVQTAPERVVEPVRARARVHVHGEVEQPLAGLHVAVVPQGVGDR